MFSRRDVRHSRGRAGGDAPRYTPTLWVANNSVTDDAVIWGYTESQYGSGDYAGAPAVTLRLIGINDAVFHGLSVMPDSSLIAAVSEGTGDPPGNAGEGLVVIPERLTHRSSALVVGPNANDTKDWNCNDVTDPLAHTGSRFAFTLPDGQVAFGRGDYHARVSLTDLRTIGPANAIVFTGTIGGSGVAVGWDCQTDSAGNIWYRITPDAPFADVLCRIPGGMTASGNTACDRVAAGSNIATSYAEGDLALDAAGGVWLPQYSLGEVRYFDAATLAALTGVASNPAPTRVISNASWVGCYGINLDVDGNMWLTNYDTGDIYFLTAAQIATGGAKTPTRTLTAPTGTIMSVRFAPGYGAFLR